MKRDQINTGGLYLAKVNGKITTVRVDSIRDGGSDRPGGSKMTRYDVTNLATGRSTVFRSASKFIREAPTSAGPTTKPTPEPFIEMDFQNAPELKSSPITAYNDKTLEGEKSADPTTTVGTVPSSTSATVPSATVGSAAVVTDSSKPVKSVLNGVSLRPTPQTGLPPHVVIIARAGTGKTTTLVEGLKLLRGQQPRIQPSEQQKVIWDALQQSRHRCKFICMTAFNVKIAEELARRVPENVDVRTVHGLGSKCLRRSYGDVNVVTSRARTRTLLAKVTGRPVEDIVNEWPRIVSVVDALVSKAKTNLVGADALRRRGECDWQTELTLLADRYDVDFGDRYSALDDAAESMRCAMFRDLVLDLVPRVLGETMTLGPDKQICYDDMIWLPVVNDLPAFRYDLLLVDEAQDLNRCQQALVRRMADRLILCGDDKQAIYGFAGADSESIPRMIETLKRTPRDCVVLSLTVTRRCGRKIVEEARKYVGDFSAHESNPEGVVRTAPYWRTATGKVIDDDKSYLPEVRESDMILCRSNAPLVANCLKLLKRKMRAFIAGREIGDTIVSLVTGMEATTVPDLVAKINEWARMEVERLSADADPDESKIEQVYDKRDCALAFTEGATSVEQVIQRIDELFSDSERPGVRLSSIHKAKGLEASRVFLLQPGGPRRRRQAEQDWQWEQELNLRYVAVTRAIDELIVVS